MFQGVAAARIRSLFKAARKNSPAIIFIGGGMWGGAGVTRGPGSTAQKLWELAEQQGGSAGRIHQPLRFLHCRHTLTVALAAGPLASNLTCR